MCVEANELLWIVKILFSREKFLPSVEDDEILEQISLPTTNFYERYRWSLLENLKQIIVKVSFNIHDVDQSTEP